MAPVSMLPVPVQTQQRWTLLAVCLAALALPLSFSAGAVAVPALARSVASSPSVLAWVTNAFMLTFGSLLLAAGGLADRYGRRRLFLLGTAGFTIATIAVCLAPTLPSLDLARGLQGVAAAAALASGTAALAHAWQGPMRGRVFALLGATFGAGLALGPLLAGLLLQALGWRSVFAVGGVLTLAAFVLGARVLPESHGERGRLDVGGMLGFSLMLAALTLALLWLGEFGLHTVRVQLVLLATLLLGAAFICIERLHRSPLLDLSLFSQPAFLGVQLLPVATCFGYVVLLVVLPLQLLGVHGQSATLVGLQMLALSAPMLVLPMLVARWAERVGSARLCTLGLLVCASGLYLLSRHASQPSPSQWVPWLMLVGAGTALPWGLMDGLSVSVVPVQRAGMAAGIFGTVRVAGEGIALAAVTALLALLIGHQLQGASPASLARAGAYLATGAREQAQALLPAMSRMQLQHASSEALATLLRVLALLTAACAALLHLLLRKRKDALVGRTA
ncbi:TPA: MFS transporter [Stenotrophomonas maltophilia]|uniref:MFS transporter n=1 Tax=Stenotrophomonas maltophilia TaxID=40324 RepID=UPI00066E3F86|nr:MFS transporter [Stenotrophomonas maltophilia]ELK2665442.1 MFS transporter [Stenotrophomonas maltophilia]KUJ02635.1 MFS transporter [Stenotrophomonas maltophilia]MBH1375089.1 MFS transporter [Stenotrophomonas maltophilia]MBH1438623.1 MFS transporter [Stenotrophomonas maltophilia]MBH1557612.1 MFS transporter [Stenotrophomonas maltophilia]